MSMDQDRLKKSPREEGTVKWFDRAVGYGYISSDADGREELIFGSGAVVGRRVGFLGKGVRVSFEVVEGRKGKQALNIEEA